MRSPKLPLTPTTRRRPALGAALLAVGAMLAGSFVTGAGAASAAPQPKQGSEPAFRVVSFNILGFDHTEKGPKAKRFDNGVIRIGRALRILERRSVDVAGLQELQPEQYDRFTQIVGEEWAAYPGYGAPRPAVHNSIVWRTAEWDAVELRTIKIPYFHGKRIQMPQVLLQHKATEQLVWFANFHNPADGRPRGSQKRWREEAKAIQVQLANDIAATGVPLVITGDMNERESYFCTMVGQAPMQSASGGSVTKRKCNFPDNSRIDWIFGSEELQFSNYRLAESRNIQRTTDHPLIQADVTFPASATRR